ncbi:MAG: hypothetical protein IPL53_20135 [Ignavibacteria bacterium]|nr:hypothetical protein [Ignavibacteria bacterium]
MFNILLTVISGCDKISSGMQRKQFEFLYKMNNYSSLFREYTGGISYYSDLDFYENRMVKLHEDVSKMEAVPGYDVSEDLKAKLLITINENISSVNTIKQKQRPVTENIREEFDVRMMNERVDEFIEELNLEITKVGKQ